MKNDLFGYYSGTVILISVSQRRFDLCGLCLIKSNQRGRRNGGVGGECGGSGGGQKEDHRVLDLSRRGLGILSFEAVKEPLSMSLILSFLLSLSFLFHIDFQFNSELSYILFRTTRI